MSEQGQHLVDLVHAQGLLALLKLAHKPQSDARFLCQIGLRQVELLARTLTKEDKDMSIAVNFFKVRRLK